MSTTWAWDATRQEYYYWSVHEECWVYQSGQKIHPQTTPTASDSLDSQFASLDIRASSTASTAPDTSHFAAQQRRQVYNQHTVPNYSYITPSYSQDNTSSTSPGLMVSPCVSSLSLNSLGYNQPSSYSTSSQPLYSSQHSTYTPPQYTQSVSTASVPQTDQRQKQNNIIRAPKNEITDEELYRQGATAQWKVTGTSGDQENLDSGKGTFLKDTMNLTPVLTKA
jgi:hypothetical protein